ncbi:MAG: transcription termination factor Rho [Opitutales bacterium]|nr:transcription termination factor Rho [Opitutales bacterium]
MPTKKTTKSTPKKVKEIEKESLPLENATPTEVKKDAPVEKPKPKKATPKKTKPVVTEPVKEAQLFFSTDGSEPDKPASNPYEKEANAPQPLVEKPETNNIPENKPVSAPNKPQPQQPQPPQPPQQPQPQNHRHNHPNQQGHQQGQGNKNFKKQNWQDKKRQKNNKPRPKFKKPRKLPFEDTESKSLELGNLLEFEGLKTEEGISTLAELFAGSDEAAINFNELYLLPLQDLKEKVSSLEVEIELPPAPIREEIFDLLFDACLEKKQPVEISAILEVTEDGHGFLLQEKDNYRLRSQSPLVPAALVKRFGLKTGHLVQGFIHPKMEQSTCPIVIQIDKVMNGDPEEATRIMPFTELVPYYPLDRIYLETKADVEWDNVSMRVVDLVSPIGFGQRGLIVAPPRTGKTVLQQAIARALRVNNPKAHLIVLLVDERPEEVTDFRRQVPDSEVIASTFDESAESHVHAAEIVIEKARRMVECNQDVVILLDSITRLARAYNATMPNSGKILSGGVEATALQRPKRFFGSARNIEGGGSLTILGTALVETGSKMDEVIFEEFKGTGNMELHLDRELSNKRIFPALDFEKSGTRKEELLYHPDELNKIYSLRRSLKGVPPVEAMEMFIQRVRKTKNNPEFLVGLGR